jgi:hypothetical protein
MGINNASIPTIISTCRGYIFNLKGNSLFPEVHFKEPVNSLDLSVNELERIFAGPATGSKTLHVAEARKEVTRCLRIVVNAVENLANQAGLTDNERADLVKSAGMTKRNFTGQSRQVFKVVHGPESGSAELTAQGGADANEWQSTNDLVTFANRVAHKTTTKAKTIVTGLTPGEKRAFFHRAIIANKETTWEGPLFLIIV